jgi:hypothetical protein
VTPTVAIIGAGAGGIAMGVRLGEAGDVELPLVPRAAHDLPLADAAQHSRYGWVELVGAADEFGAQGGAFVRAVVGDGVDGSAYVVHPDTERADRHQIHGTRWQFVDRPHRGAFAHVAPVPRSHE